MKTTVKKTVNLVIVDDNTEFRRSLNYLLSADERFNIIGSASCGEELLNSDYLLKADVILLDVEMPGMGGIETARMLSFHYPYIHTVAMTMYNDIVYLRKLIEAGFKAFVSKVTLSDEIYSALEKVLDNKYFFPEKIKLDLPLSNPGKLRDNE